MGRVVIFDDLYPYPVSRFRYAEYTELLRRLPDSSIVASLSLLDALGRSGEKAQALEEYLATAPELAARTTLVDDASQFASPQLDTHLTDATLFYTIFVNGAYQLLEAAERHRTNFAFTLYPGGGFLPRVPAFKQKLRALLEHPLLSGVIVTQPHSMRLLRRHFPVLSRRANVRYVFGGVLPEAVPGAHRSTPTDGNPVNVCFIAQRYDPDGRDKGFDVFREVVRRFTEGPRSNAVRFHCIGPWDSDDFGALDAQVTRHGVLSGARLDKVLRLMDVGVFPSRANVLASGAFDGFPVGAAIDMALAGAAILTTNPLRQRTPLRPGDDYLAIEDNAASVGGALAELVDDRGRLDELRRSGRAAFERVYAIDAQMQPRACFLSELAAR